jgi:uncharacterized hydrophobic protein (TIGR00271 family)
MEQENRLKTWLSQYLKPVDYSRRKEIVEDITTAATPGFDYFFLVILSSSIATLGLINDSPAVIIGAMLVAPLMSPILGVGLGSLTADAKLARNSFTALIRAAVLSILLAILITLSNIYIPFVPSLIEVPQEVLSRTQPTVNDLIIALAGGLAASYALAKPNLSAALPGVAIATALMPPLSTVGIGIALGRWDIAISAALLFLTNAITIAFSAILIFFLEGFRPRYRKDDDKPQKTLLIAGILTGLLLIPLTVLGARLVSQTQENRLINTVIETEIADMLNAEIADLTIISTDPDLLLDLTIRSNYPPSHNQVVSLQEALVARFERPVALTVTHIRAEKLDPLIPPTYTPTPVTPTVGPTPTSTATLTPSATITSSPTATFTSSPTPTVITPTATPRPAIVINTGMPLYYELLQQPGGPVIGRLNRNAPLLDLYEQITYEGLVWIRVMDEEGRIGWFPQRFMLYPTPSPTPTIINE